DYTGSPIWPTVAESSDLFPDLPLPPKVEDLWPSPRQPASPGERRNEPLIGSRFGYTVPDWVWDWRCRPAYPEVWAWRRRGAAQATSGSKCTSPVSSSISRFSDCPDLPPWQRTIFTVIQRFWWGM